MTSYLIRYQRRTGKLLDLIEFDSLYEATMKRLELEKTNDDPDIEIVAIASESESQLRVSHSRYFSAA
ncbi:MAG: hypothetical protein SPJ78_02465 [Corynebacterium camporealensis]|uniref:hypothetical protein n=1 Tax=Corynebacterium camporealensis TaxID=161896 RepID=UPI002A9142D3|nr:hypothetical protein [Corynebacterium camporealensis]MDY5839577.1 hypothetical protein [Corynebacterium camporealensis]